MSEKKQRYIYETHLHTSPASRCARYGVEDNLRFYSALGFDGVFITNHFLDGNVGVSGASYSESVSLYFEDYRKGVELADQIGISVFCGAELSYKGTDFLVYGLDEAWYLSHPEIMDMKKSEELPYLINSGAFVVQAHPFREARYIDHIRLFPGGVQGIEIYNANRTAKENEMAKLYAELYGFIPFAGTDNHISSEQRKFGAVRSDKRISDEHEFVSLALARELEPVMIDLDENIFSTIKFGKEN